MRGKSLKVREIDYQRIAMGYKITTWNSLTTLENGPSINMVLQVEIIFTNGLTLASGTEPLFLGVSGIDGYISLADHGDVGIDILQISLHGG